MREDCQKATAEGLDNIRRAIDAIDEDIIRLLRQRAGLALEAGRLKKSSGRSILDPDRENLIIGRLAALAEEPLSGAAVTDIYQAIIKACRKLQNNSKP